MADYTKLFGASALAALLLATPALAQEAEEGVGEIGTYDADADGALSEEEFGMGLGEAGIYDEFDADDDGMLSEEEFDAGLFDGYDRDDDGLIGEPEIGDVNDDLGEAGLFDF